MTSPEAPIITGVDCSRDLEHARVYFTTVDSATREPVLAELRNVKGVLRSMLGQVLKLRHIPALEFVIDRSPDYGEHIDNILRGLGLTETGRIGNGDESREDEEDEEENEDDDD